MGHVITIFGSSRPVPGSTEYAAAYSTGRELAVRGFTVCNGGYGGTMEAASKGAKEAGGATIGVTSAVFSRGVNPWVDQEIKTKSLIERLAKLMELGEGYVVLKGGTGTLLELAAVWEMINKGFERKKPVVTIGPFWTPVLETIQRELISEGMEGGASFTGVITPKECAEFFARSFRLP